MLTGSLVENLITMLVYSDQHAGLIRNLVPISMWAVPYRIVAVKCYEYLDSFKVPPKDHIADLLEDKISKDDGEAKIFLTLLANMQQANFDGINTEYVFNRLNLYIRRQSLRTVAVELTKALQQDTEESLDKAEQLMATAKHIRAASFDPGTKLSDKDKALKFLYTVNEAFPTGISELDRRGLGPARKELFLAMGDAKIGKTKLLIHLGKRCLMHRYRVLHITLEMSEEKVAQQYLQTFHSVSKRTEGGNVPKFKKDENGYLVEIMDSTVTAAHSFEDHNIKDKLSKLIDKWKTRHHNNIYIKQFPTGSLTVNELNGYLDSLESISKFQPDLVIIDYPELMKLDKDNYRLAIDETYKNLRGIAVERNLGMAVVSQTNRAASQKKVVTSDNIAEAYNKVQHADLAISLSATSVERKLGLLRMTVTNARNDEGNLTIIVSQNYRTATFSVDAVIQPPSYWGMLPEEGNGE